MLEKKRKIYEEEDYIDHPKYKNSLAKLIEKYPDGVDDETIAKVLNISEEEVEEIYQSAIEKLKANLGV
jgi:DNA-directed RNA polymerase specialized sigma subunit